MLIDDFRHPHSRLGTTWQALSDRVMGGISDVDARRTDGALHLGGRVRRVPGSETIGFVQLGLDLGALDGRAYEGLYLDVCGDGATYGAHLRTSAVARPWQSFRAHFVAPKEATRVQLPWSSFAPYRIDAAFDPGDLRRLTLLCIGREADAHLTVSEVGLYGSAATTG
jgi:hypothetical protein